jgi:ankyrin repeat protein
VDLLKDTTTKKQVKSALMKISKRLQGAEDLVQVYDQLYDNTIKRIESQPSTKSALARNVLSWITYAERPLTTEELCHALAIELGKEDLDEDNVPEVEEIISVCAGLVIVDEVSNIIRLVHYTTQEYFKRIREKWNPNAQLEIASACLTYLSFHPFKSGSYRSNEEFRGRLVFLNYASRYWARYARTVQKQVSEVALLFLQDGNLVSRATETILRIDYGNNILSFPREVTGLHLTAEFGLLHLLERLLSQPSGDAGAVADSNDSNGQTPLSQAARHGHEAVVRLLLETGKVDVNSKDKADRTPLMQAVGYGHEAVVKLLLETDKVDVNLKSIYDWTPLSLAARNGYKAVVKLLLETDKINVDSKDRIGQTPLFRAAEYGYEAVVKLLLETGKVDVNSKNLSGQTPLLLAAEYGHEAIVKLLLETGKVDVNSKNLSGQTPLSLAAQNKHEAVVKVLQLFMVM